MKGVIDVGFKPSPSAQSKTFTVSYDLTYEQMKKAVQQYVAIHFQTAMRGNCMPPFITDYHIKK